MYNKIQGCGDDLEVRLDIDSEARNTSSPEN